MERKEQYVDLGQQNSPSQKRPKKEYKKSKDQSFNDLMNSVISLDFKKGHLNWTITDLSRQSGMTRSLIYHYFGKDKLALLLESIRQIGEQLIGSNGQKWNLWDEGRLGESFVITRQQIAKNPELIPFYYFHRDKPGEVGEVIRELERIYMDKVRHFYPQLSEKDRMLIVAFSFGVTFFPDIPEDVVLSGGQKIYNSFRTLI